MYDTQLKQVESALDYLDAGAFEYNDWSKVGRAIADFDNGATGFHLFDDWCSKDAGRYKANEVASQWKSFRNSRNTTIASLFYEAKQAGWSPEYDSPEEIQQAVDERRRSAAERAAKREADDKRKAQETARKLEQNRKDFLALSPMTEPHPYLQQKQLHNAAQYIDIRTGHDSQMGYIMAWPFQDIDGNWAGYERISFDTSTGKNTKKSRAGSISSQGFAVLGNLQDADRVFVMGGFADALTAHICTGFTTVSVPGEGMIPGTINRLRERYPDKDFVCAPDNDETGKKVAERAGGLWVIPMGVKDWSDLFLSQGQEAVKVQLSQAYGWKQVNINQRYLNIDIRTGMANKIISAKESGKTNLMIQVMKKNPHLKTLIISYRVSLLQSLQKAFSDDNITADLYSDLDGFWLRNSRRLVCSMDSLWKLAGSQWDLVIMDECEQDFQHFQATTMQNKTLNTDVLAHILRTAHTTVYMDANLGRLTNGFLSEIGITHGIEFINAAKPREDSTMYFYESKNALTVEIMKCLAAGEPVYICSNAKGWLNQLAAKFKKDFNLTEFEDMMLITSDNSQSDEVSSFLKKVGDDECAHDFMDKYKALLGSPSIGTGLDIKKGKHPYAKTFGYFTNNTGTAEQAHQQLCRARGVTEYHVYVREAGGSKITNPDQIRQLILEERSAETAHFIGLDYKTGNFTTHPLFEWLYCNTAAILNENYNRFSSMFERLTRDEGYTIEYLAQNKAQSKRMGEQMSDIRADLEYQYKQDMQRVPLLSDLAKQEVHAGNLNRARQEVMQALQQHYADQQQPMPEMKQSDLDKLVEMARLKTQVHFDMNLANLKHDPETVTDLLNELAVEEHHARRVSAFKRLSNAFLPEAVAYQLDKKNVETSKTVAEWKHTGQKRRILLKLLAAAGLDEEMNLDPEKTWSFKDIKKLMQWMQKNRKSLIKYMGINLSDYHLMEPIRWYNDLLRSLQLPVDSIQRRVEGSGDRYRVYRIDPSAIRPVRELVLNRVEGIVNHQLEQAEESRQAKAAEERMNPVTAPAQIPVNCVTPQPVCFNNKMVSGVTSEMASQASIHAGSGYSEKEGSALEISSLESTTSDTETKTIRQRAMEKIRGWFPDLKKETGSEAHQGITDKHLEGYLSEIDVKEIDSGAITQTGMSDILDMLAGFGGHKYFK